jgi:hypothetical protein
MNEAEWIFEHRRSVGKFFGNAHYGLCHPLLSTAKSRYLCQLFMVYQVQDATECETSRSDCFLDLEAGIMNENEGDMPCLTK